MNATNAYAIDGLCHNANCGTYGHECGKPARWLGTDAEGFTMGYCEHCRHNGHEARGVRTWAPAPAPVLTFHTDAAHGWLEISRSNAGRASFVRNLPGIHDDPPRSPARAAPRQAVIPGAAHDVAGLLARKAAAPLKPRVAQAPCDGGLFFDAAAQTDLVDLVNRRK